MGKLTKDRPKCLFELAGKSLLEWQLNALQCAGVDKIAIVTGYKREMLASWGLVEFINDDWQTTDMVYSLSKAEDWLNEDLCVVSYSDIFYERSAIDPLIKSKADVAVLYDPNWRSLWERRFGDPLLDAETFRRNLDGTLAEIGAKPGSIGQIEGQYMGLLRITPAGWREILRMYKSVPVRQRGEIQMTHLLQMIVKTKSLPIQTLPYLGKWGEIDNENDLLVAQETLEI